MLGATWVLAGATVVLALTVPFALATWIHSRKQDTEDARRNQFLEAARKEFVSHDQALELAGRKFVSQDQVVGGLIVAAIIGIIIWASHDKPKEELRK
jgi:hypothetical protein